MDISILRTRRLGRDAYRRIDMPEYTQYHFGMYDGDVENVTVELENDLIGVFIDRFGKKIPVTPVDDDHVAVTITAAVSPPVPWLDLCTGAWGQDHQSSVRCPCHAPRRRTDCRCLYGKAAGTKRISTERETVLVRRQPLFLVLEGAFNLAEDSFVRNHLDAGRGFFANLVIKAASTVAFARTVLGLLAT